MKPFFQQKGYEALNAEFHDFNECETDVFFIDGGNALTSDREVQARQLIRTATIHFKGKKRTIIKQKEGVCNTTLVIQDNRQHYMNVLSGAWHMESTIDAYDAKLSAGERQIPIEQMGQVLRRFAELTEAQLLAEEHSNSIIVLDGTLESVNPDEEEKLHQLYATAAKQNNIVIGFNKTNTIQSEDGSSFADYLERTALQQKGYVYPVAKAHTPLYQAEMCFVKLHPKSRKVFRLDIKGDVRKAVSSVASTACDFTFPGYPYGLLLADRLARVKNEEKRMFKQREEIFGTEQRGAAIQAHDMLDKFN